METILLEEKEILEYIYDNIIDTRFYGPKITNAKYHHNSAYKDAVSICKYGILSLNDLYRKKIKFFSKDFLNRMDDIDSHVNGSNGISLSIVGLNDIYPNEFEYNPFLPYYVDFLIDSDIITSRVSTHYGNEFLSYTSIGLDKIKAVDIRLLQLLREQSRSGEYSISRIIQKYNHLRNIALELRRQIYGITLREMSEFNIFELDVEKLANQPMLILKNNN